MRIRKHQYLLILLFTLFLSSCSMAPHTDYAALVEQDRNLVSNWEQQKTAEQTTSLNKLINSPDLDALITEALAANPTLQQTMLSLKQKHYSKLLKKNWALYREHLAGQSLESFPLRRR